jgi:hypothetical protein
MARAWTIATIWMRHSRRRIPEKGFDRVSALRARTQTITLHLTEFLKKTKQRRV